VTAASEAAIAFEHVSKRYSDGSRAALDDVSLVIAPRTFVAIVGPSGSGKTTLLRLVNRLADPTHGTVQVDGGDVTAADPVQLRRRIGYVFQGIGLFPHMTVAENIGITPKLIGWDAARIAQRVDGLLDLVRLGRSYRDRYPQQLSGGERQRIGVARALAAEPKIMLMDEPFGALDPITRDGLARDYRALHEQLGLTTAMITHDMTEALLLADRIVLIRAGRIVANGTPAELMQPGADPFVTEMLDMPLRQAERLQALRSQA